MRLNTKTLRWLLMGIFLLLVIFLWFFIFIETRGQVLQVSFLDVGQGDAIFIEAPNGNQVLIDGGKGSATLRSLGKVMPFYDRSIDLVIATHPDADHIGGLSFIFDRFAVGGVMDTGLLSESDAFSLYKDRKGREKAEMITSEAGSRIILDDDVVIDILFPHAKFNDPDSNDNSVVTLLRFGETSFLLTGDAGLEVENYLARTFGEGINVDVLKLGHHGSQTSSSEYFLSATSPEWAVISAGRDNRYGHPHREVLERLEKMNIPYASTAEAGNIYFESDGMSIKCVGC